MKTRLLLLFALYCSALTFGQISVNESFDNGIPTGWTVGGSAGFQTSTVGPCGGLNSLYVQNDGSNVMYSFLKTTSYTSNGQPITASFKHRVYNNFNQTSSGVAYLFYELNNSGSILQLATIALANVCTTLSGTISSVTAPSGTTINFYVQVNRNSGSGAIYVDDVNISQIQPTPTISNVSHVITNNSATISYSLNANSSPTTSVIKYGLTAGNLDNQVSGFAASGNTVTSNSATITGLSQGTQYFYRVEATNSGGTVLGTIGTFTTFGPPIISFVSAVQITSTSAGIQYAMNPNITVGSATSYIIYGLTSTSMTNQVAGFTYSGTNSAYDIIPINGLSPNTQYFYQIFAINSNGTSQSSIFNFTTNPPLSAIADYNFNNTRLNILGTEPFSTANTTFTVDRNSVANNALYILDSSTGTTATISSIPTGNQSRTISFWYKVSSNVANSAIFSYGSASTNQTFGMYIQGTGRPTFQAYGTDQIFGNGTFAANNWHHIVLTYDGTNVRIYMNGVLADTMPYSLNTGSSSIKFGNNSAILSVDDLKIYGEAISQENVTSLYNTNALSSQNFNQNNIQVSLYPNPVNDVLNIETALDVQTVEIYTIQGQKVLSSNQKQINVSDLAAGMYIVRIQDGDNNIATKKIIIK